MTVDNYLAQLTKNQRDHYAKLKSLVLQTVPEAEEVISYGMPTFKYKKRPLIYFGAFKNHMSLFPASGNVITQLGNKLAGHHSSKGTVKFTEDNPISDEVVKEMLHLRLQEIE